MNMRDSLNKKYLLVLALLLVIIGICYFIYNSNRELSDSQRFKNEYESINNKINESNGKKYRNLSISKDNPMVYSTAEEIIKMMNNKETFVVYFGFSTCPWCRSVIETLIDVANDYNLDKIYYVDVKDIRDVIELDDNNNLITTTKGTDAYYKLLDRFGSLLEEYKIKDSDGNNISADEKRIYAPNVANIIKGVPKELTTGISDLQNDAYMDLSDEMKEEIYEKFKCIVKCALDSELVCPLEDRC